MEIKKFRTRSESASTMTELVLPNDTNIIGNLLGGRLLHWIDIAGALAATRHTGGLVATITMDMVEFRNPAKVGNIVTLYSYVTWTGKTSVETAVEVFVEDALSGEKKFINRSYLVFVGIDKDGAKREIIPYMPVTDDEKAEFDMGYERKNRRISVSQSVLANCVNTIAEKS